MKIEVGQVRSVFWVGLSVSSCWSSASSTTRASASARELRLPPRDSTRSTTRVLKTKVHVPVARRWSFPHRLLSRCLYHRRVSSLSQVLLLFRPAVSERTGGSYGAHASSFCEVPIVLRRP